MSLLNQITQHLINQNQFSIHKAMDLSSALCHAWFISQDSSHSEYTQALELVERHASHPIIEFVELCQTTIEQELEGRTLPQGVHALWTLFSPEAIECEENPLKVREKIQAKRTITKLEKTSQVITDVADQLLLTSNVLLGIPLDGDSVEHIQLGERFQRTLAKAQFEEQEYWYDHPIPVGISSEENEILYGIKHLDQALDTEFERGNLREGQKLTIALSCSVTHPSLARIAKEYVEYEIRTHLNLKHIEVAVFGENECLAILAEAFPNASEHLKGVFGVNGAYGRHYTFLKAIAPLWQKGIKPSLKATFKIDLDQIFEQSMLIEETGKSFFEHLTNSNWGANGIDADGNKVHLGMLGGGLVNETDAHKGLFTADVKAPNGSDYAIFEQLFCARWGQALSTEEEIISKREDLQRVHVTGGTNGILIESLYKYRPYTPTFIHRAEDQAFILSALANPVDDQYLVYSHQPGLIMRHDKEAFAGRVMQASESGKVLGDIERVLLFSTYAKYHPLGLDALKDKLYPFTSSFVSPTPVTLALLRFLLEGSFKDAEYLDSGANRLIKCFNYCQNSLKDEVHSNQLGWDEYYQSLMNTELNQATQFVLNECLLNLE